MNINALRLYNVLYFALFSITLLSAEDEGPFIISNQENTTKTYNESGKNEGKGDSGTVTIDDIQRVNNVDFTTNLVEETASLNGINIEDPAVTLSLKDVATAELQQRATFTSSSQEYNIKENESDKVSVNLSYIEKKDDLKQPQQQQQQQPPSSTSDKVLVDLNSVKDNENITEEIPSFSEWTQKRLEAEKSKEIVNTSIQNQNLMNTNKSGTKLRWKNYASPDCGAKVVASNPETVSPSAILSPSRDEYKLNPCTSRIWFIVELCEAIQAKKIDLANFELFSSSPQDFLVSVSDRFPTREWSNVGQFTAKDERDIQSFDLYPHLFGKYIKVEIKSHYGKEHYCPISLFRVYGTSEFEVLQKEDAIHINDDDDDSTDDEDLDIENDGSTKNLFNSATNVVISMVKKVGQVLGKSNTNNFNETKIINYYSPFINDECITPSHLIVCFNCTNDIYEKIYNILSCRYNEMRNLISIPFISNTLIKSNICHKFGFDFNKNQIPLFNTTSSYLESVISRPLLGALCNTIGIIYNKVVLNISTSYINQTDLPPPTTTTTTNDIVNLTIQSNDDVNNINLLLESSTTSSSFIDDLPIIESSEYNQIYTCSTDINQMKPTKALPTTDSNVVFVDNNNNNNDDYNDFVATSLLPITLETVIQNEKSSEQQQPSSSSSSELFDQSENISDVADIGENTDNLDYQLLISDLNDTTPPTPSSDGGVNGGNSYTQTTNTPQIQKESVFLRLSNRIKALERNMSLSSQYLEELSKRYKKQVEEMQKLERVLAILNDESVKSEERNKQLEDKLNRLEELVDRLSLDNDNYRFYVILIVIITFLLFSYCRRNNDRDIPIENISIGVKPKRRKSIDVVTTTAINKPNKKKQRRPSDQALKIVRSSMITDDRNKKKKKRKISNTLKRSNSITLYTYSGDWIDETKKKIDEIPIVLDESEHSTLEPFTTDKIQLPNYIKTAINSRIDRNITCQNNNNNNNNNGQNTIYKKEDNIECLSLDGRASEVNHTENTPKKERKGLKRIFKKVF